VAIDNIDGDISDNVSAFGRKALSTTWLTEPGKPNVLTYSVKDAAGNSAIEQQRWVFVFCGQTEVVCLDESMKRYCSVGGVCSPPLELSTSEGPHISLLVRSHSMHCTRWKCVLLQNTSFDFGRGFYISWSFYIADSAGSIRNRRSTRKQIFTLPKDAVTE
jgi:hypothetical protein